MGKRRILLNFFKVSVAFILNHTWRSLGPPKVLIRACSLHPVLLFLPLSIPTTLAPAAEPDPESSGGSEPREP